MILTTTEVFLTIIVISIATFFTRVTPFILFPANKDIPRYVEYLGNVLPFAIIGMLIIYCLKSVSLLSFPYGIPESIAIIFIIVIHKWKHNLLFSIGGGTILYMFLVQTIFL